MLTVVNTAPPAEFQTLGTSKFGSFVEWQGNLCQILKGGSFGHVKMMMFMSAVAEETSAPKEDKCHAVDVRITWTRQQ